MKSQAEAKLAARIASYSTQMLLDIARKMNLLTTVEAIIVSAAVANELERRLEDSVFLALMLELEAALCVA